MPVRVCCPHCKTPCTVAEQHLGVPVQCGRCSRTFTTRAEAAFAPPSIRLDIGAATSTGRVRERNEDSFLVQHLVCSNLDDLRESAVSVVAKGREDRANGLVIRAIGAALAPLLNNMLGEASMDVVNVAEAIAVCKGMGASAAVVVVWDGRVIIGQIGDCRVYQLRGGQLTQIARDRPFSIGKAVVGDWLIAACDGLHAHLEPPALQALVAKSASSATALAHELVERVDRLGGSDNCTVVAVHCY